MRKQKIIICDTDSAYLRALCAYIISSGRRMELSSYSSIEKFQTENGIYDVALLGKAFLQNLEERGEDLSRFGKIFVLTGDINETGGEHTVLYKFQQMKGFLAKMQQYYSHNLSDEDIAKMGDVSWTGIYSPIRHELQLLFALAYCKQKKDENPEDGLLFVDLEENSLMGDMMPGMGKKNVTDYLYLLESNTVTRDELMGCISYYENFAYLSPVRYFQELVSIDGRRWRRFFSSLCELGYKHIVVLFDSSLRGMEALFDYLKDLVLVGREGDFYRKYDRQIQSFLKDRDRPMEVRETLLPLTGANLSDGTYRF
ncbi:MAG: hypothetical protein IJ679_04245, partial [Lachnospiraceae bacterium]|nr:hypothetical protein [Lachnospiraceae bacterium]